MLKLPDGTVTFLFTDIEGSTKLLHELGDEYADALANHRRLLREAFDRHDGVEVDTQGDAFFVVFARASDAVSAAEDGRRVLEPGPIRVRMGLHTGEPRLTEQGYVGLAVHEGARIAACSHGGQVVISRRTKELAGDGFVFVDLGEHRVKDFAEPVWIFQLGEERFPPLKTISNTNLPRPASSFVGRGGEVAEIVELLQEGARLITLTGPGGSGKTRVAIEAAAEVVPEYRNGVFWVGLAALRDPALVTEAISQTLGAKDGLVAYLGERELLLLLDNFEQVAEAAPELTSLLSSCPHLRLLVTSRELLRVQGEVEYAVPPLAEEEAVELFSARSRLEPDTTIAELCIRLDNLPLAVELAAARTSVLSSAQILERLSQRLDLLKGGRDTDPRQQTLRATIQWSHDLLSTEEQRLFARLAVFDGGCTLDASEEVADANLDTLQSLVDKSLLRHTGERFWMLETIREYATERLEESGERGSVTRRHSAWIIAAASRESPAERIPSREWLDRLDAEKANVRAALASLDQANDVEGVARLAACVWPWWFIRGRMTEGRSWLDRAAVQSVSQSVVRWEVLEGASELAWRQGDYEYALETAERALNVAHELQDVRFVTQALRRVGTCWVGIGETDRAAAFFEESAASARSSGDRMGLAAALANLGDLSLSRGEWERARTLSDEAYSIAEELGNPRELTVAKFNKGFAFLQEGLLEDARPLFVEALLPAAEGGWKEGVVFPIEALSAVAAGHGDAERAARLLGAAARLREEVGLKVTRTEGDRLERTFEAVREALTPAVFERAIRDGRRLDLDQAAAEALLVR